MRCSVEMRGKARSEDMPAFGREAEPCRRLRGVAQHALAAEVHLANAERCRGMTLTRGLAIECEGTRLPLPVGVSRVIETGEVELRDDIAAARLGLELGRCEPRCRLRFGNADKNRQDDGGACKDPDDGTGGECAMSQTCRFTRLPLAVRRCHCSRKAFLSEVVIGV